MLDGKLRLGKLRAAALALGQCWDRPILGFSGGAGSETPYVRRSIGLAGWRIAILVGVLLAVVAGVLAYGRASMLTPVIHQYYGYGVDEATGPRTTNLLFDSDIPKITLVMTLRDSEKHVHTAEHPLMSLIINPPVSALRQLGLPHIQAIRLTVAGLSALWTGLLFSLLTLWGLRLLDAALFTAMALSSAAAMFWFSVPEVFAFGSATIVAALILTMWPQRAHRIVRYAAAAALTLSMTVTNCMVGLLAMARQLTVKDIWIAGASAWFIVTILWGFEKLIFPETSFFMPPRGSWVSQYMFMPTPARIGEILQTYIFHTMVMPDIRLLSGEALHLEGSTDLMMSVQRSLPGSSGLLGLGATIAWLALLGTAAWATWRNRPSLTLLCLLISGCQIVLHLFFGSETFLYTMHFLPLLIVFTAGVTFTRLRTVGLALAAAVTLLGGANNWAAFREAAAVVQSSDALARTFPGARPYDAHDMVTPTP